VWPISDTAIDDRPDSRKRLQDFAQFRFEVGKAPVEDPALFVPAVFRERPGPEILRKQGPLGEPVLETTIGDHPDLRKGLQDFAQFRFEVGKAPIDDPVRGSSVLERVGHRDRSVKKYINRPPVITGG
jgi:hypothetical protein